MNVRELVAKLNELNPDDFVIVNGYEGGVNDITEIENVRIERNVNVAWYYGSHEIADDEDVNTSVPAVRLS